MLINKQVFVIRMPAAMNGPKGISLFSFETCLPFLNFFLKRIHSPQMRAEMNHAMNMYSFPMKNPHPALYFTSPRPSPFLLESLIIMKKAGLRMLNRICLKKCSGVRIPFIMKTRLQVKRPRNSPAERWLGICIVLASWTPIIREIDAKTAAWITEKANKVIFS